MIRDSPTHKSEPRRYPKLTFAGGGAALTGTPSPGKTMDNRDRVRLIITDTNPEKQIFKNEEIDEFLAMEGSEVKPAAALALETIATSEALTLKVISLLDLSTNGVALSAELRARAKDLRAQEAEEFDSYDVFEDDSTVEMD